MEFKKSFTGLAMSEGWTDIAKWLRSSAMPSRFAGKALVFDSVIASSSKTTQGPLKAAAESSAVESSAGGSPVEGPPALDPTNADPVQEMKANGSLLLHATGPAAMLLSEQNDFFTNWKILVKHYDAITPVERFELQQNFLSAAQGSTESIDQFGCQAERVWPACCSQ